MDLTTKSQTWGADDQSWRLSRKGLDTARSITLDPAAFTEGTHYPDGFLKSGIPLAKRTSDGRYVPYATAGTGGAELFEGFLVGNVHVKSAGASLPDDVGGALQWEGVIDCRFVPGGKAVIDADAVTQAGQRFRFENR